MPLVSPRLFTAFLCWQANRSAGNCICLDAAFNGSPPMRDHFNGIPDGAKYIIDAISFTTLWGRSPRFAARCRQSYHRGPLFEFTKPARSNRGLRGAGNEPQAGEDGG